MTGATTKQTIINNHKINTDMQRSASITNLMSALGLFQAKAIKIRKDSTNPHFKSKYASLAAILDEIQSMLTECKLVFTQIPEESTHLITLLFHTESGEFIESRYELKSAQTTPQGIGSAITYARRYSLTSILGLNIDDDDDGNDASKTSKNTQQQVEQTANTTQPQTAITPFTRAYTDVKAVEAVIKSAAKVDELSQLYFANKDFVENNPSLKKAISDRREHINNQGKHIITDKQFDQVCDRLRKGELKVLDNAKGAYILNAGQIEKLETIATEARQLEDALAVKYNNPADIITVLNACPTEEHVMRLHSQNAMIIDREPELITKLNARIKVLKAA